VLTVVVPIYSVHNCKGYSCLPGFIKIILTGLCTHNVGAGRMLAVETDVTWFWMRKDSVGGDISLLLSCH
jgi:hypothetical protein